MLLFSLCFIAFWIVSGLVSLIILGFLDKEGDDDNWKSEEMIIAVGCGGPLSIMTGLYALLMTYIFDFHFKPENSRLYKLFLCYYRIGKGKQ